MNDTVEMESGELTESFSESENLLQNQGFLKKRSKLYRIRYRRIAPYWLRNVNIDEGWNDEEDNGDDDDEDNGDDDDGDEDNGDDDDEEDDGDDDDDGDEDDGDEDNGDDDDEEEDDDDEEEENDEDEELEAAMLSYDERNLVQLPVDEDLEESMLEIG